MEEYAVGQFFTVGKDTYKVVIDDNLRCRICDVGWFSDLCLNLECHSIDRKDHNNVSFILYDQEPDEE